ncbi:MAG TPA: PLD nuclease N-terminal domain-containing protein [Microbacteriaceae bacterium]|nr:PLD nuclease N-terminal domain-containing protein [Microbacteriaceae bacterium]
MVRLYLLLGVIVAAFYIFSIVDCALRERSRVRVLPKPVWVLIVLIPLIGGALWFLFGRRGRSDGEYRRDTAPDDDPEFLGSLGGDDGAGKDGTAVDENLEERIRELEDELSDLDKKHRDNNGRGAGHPDA